MNKPERYPQLNGKLQYLVKCTRPELAKPVLALASFTNKTTDKDWKCSLQMLSYVGTL